MTKKPKIPEWGPDEAIAQFWDTHDIADYWDELEVADDVKFPKPKKRRKAQNQKPSPSAKGEW